LLLSFELSSSLSRCSEFLLAPEIAVFVLILVLVSEPYEILFVIELP